MLKSLYAQVAPITEEEKLWLVEDVMKFLRCSEVTVWRYMHRHGLPYIKLSRTTPTLFRREKVMEWAASLEHVECSEAN